MNNAEIQYLELMYNRSINALKSFIEKQFFQCFGIEPREIPSREYDSDGEICSYYVEYPQITDSILLELIRIIGKKPFGYLQCENTYSTNLGDARDIITVEADSLKEGLLTLAIQNKVALRIKQQVRTLFEEV